MQLSDKVSDDTLEQRIRQLAPNKCCSLIYTVRYNGRHNYTGWVRKSAVSYGFVNVTIYKGVPSSRAVQMELFSTHVLG